MLIILFSLKNSPKTPTCKVYDRFRITKYKYIFSKDYTENW